MQFSIHTACLANIATTFGDIAFRVTSARNAVLSSNKTSEAYMAMLGCANKHRESLKRDVHFHLIELVNRIDIALGQTRGLIRLRIHKVGSHRTMPKQT